jgi:STE24 endopeptidase
MIDFFADTSATLATTVIFILAVLGSVLLKFWLASRQIRHVAMHRNHVPSAFAEKISLDAHQKAADYTIAKSRFGLLELAWGTTLALGWTLLGGLSLLNAVIVSAMGYGLLQQVALLGAFVLINATLEMPFTLYQTFVIEQRFGFNKTTGILWLQDLLKSTLVALVIGAPLAALVVWMMGATGPWWWLWTWGVWMGSTCCCCWCTPHGLRPYLINLSPWTTLNFSPV